MSIHQRLRHGFAALVLGALLAGGSPRAAEPSAARETPPATDTNARPGAVSPRRTAKQRLEYGQWLLADDPERALEQFDAILEEHPNSALVPQARLGRAWVLFRRRAFLSAFEEAEASFPETRPDEEELAERIRLEAGIGRYLLGYGAEELPPEVGGEKKETGYSAASRVFRAILYNDPKGPLTPQVLFWLGDALSGTGDHREAARAWRTLANRFGDHRLADKARLRAATALARAATAEETLDEEALAEAEAFLEEVRGHETPRVTGKELAGVRNVLDAARARKLLASARFYLARPTERSRTSARFVLRDLVRRYPESDAAAEARALLTELGVDPDGP